MDVVKAFAVGCFIFMLAFGCVQPPFPPEGGNATNDTPVPGLKKFNSSVDLQAFLDANTMQNGYGYEYLALGVALVRQGVMPMASSVKGAENTAAPDYSSTNVQVAGVDESDFVKSDGKYLYVMSGNTLVIMDAYPADSAKIVSQTNITADRYVPAQLFVNKDDLVAICSHGYGAGTSILQYDISDRSMPVLEKNLTADGSYFDSRMIDKYVYVVLNKPAYHYCGDEKCMPDTPVIASGGGNITPGFPDIYYFEEPAYYYTYTTVLSLDMSSAQQAPEYKVYLTGASENMYVSADNIYLTYDRIPDYVVELNKERKNEMLGDVKEAIFPPTLPDNLTEETGIRRIAMKDGKVEYAAGGFVPGTVLNQFSMDEHNGHFRIATTTGHVARTAAEASSKNHVYVLDQGMNITGRLEDLAPGEKIYSARFMGDRAYLVTFRKVDPLFVLDMADPTAPKVLGKLKIPGYSDYLHPYDETHLIGFGKDAIPSDEGDFSWYQGVKISLFDVSDVSNPKELANYKVGDRGTDSYALSDHRAFLFDKKRNLLVVPILEARLDESRYAGGVADPWQYGDYVFQGAYVFNISVDSGITLRGRITHLDSNDTLMKSGYYYSSPYDVKRSMYIGDVLYTVSDKKVAMNSLGDIAKINELALPYAEPDYAYGYMY